MQRSAKGANADEKGTKIAFVPLTPYEPIAPFMPMSHLMKLSLPNILNILHNSNWPWAEQFLNLSSLLGSTSDVKTFHKIKNPCPLENLSLSEIS